MPTREYCNKKILSETAAKTGELEKTVENIIKWHSQFIADVITSDSFEGVRIDKFGTFKAKLRDIQLRDFYKGAYLDKSLITTRVINKEEK